ncbi:MAG: ABC transporter ATP-binding protein [Microthrixaceae bacterium]
MTGLHAHGTAVVGSLTVDLDLDVAAGETLAILGPNGAGKSTVLRVLCGLLPLAAGALHLDGRLLDDGRRSLAPEARSIGVVFQDLLLFPHLDVADNVAFGLRAGGQSSTEARAHAAEWLERFGLAGHVGRAVTTLSGGEAQRVALARALAPSPRALLLDEPLAALDAEQRGLVRRELREHLALHAGPCVIVTHDPLDVAVLADRVLVMEAGRITQAGVLADVVAHPRSAWAAALAGTNLLPATADGVRLTLTGGGVLICAERPKTTRVLVAIRPAAVALHRRQPEGSARNAWAATIAEVEGFGERVRVRLDGPVPLVAEVTAAALADLGLVPGAEVWASVKATEVTAYPS